MRNIKWSISRKLDRLRSKHRIVDVHGAQFLLSSGNWIDDRLRIGREFESRQLQRAIEHVRSLNIDTFVDVGANFGLYCVLLATHCRLQRIHAFEPIRRNRAQLWANLYLNDLTHRVEVHAMALSDAAATASMQVNPASSGQATILTGEQRSSRGEHQLEEVICDTGDRQLSETDCEIFVKIDAEGHEQKVIEGMSDFIDRNRVSLQVESFPTAWPQLDQQLQLRGFRYLGSIEHDHLYQKR